MDVFFHITSGFCMEECHRIRFSVTDCHSVGAITFEDHNHGTTMRGGKQLYDALVIKTFNLLFKERLQVYGDWIQLGLDPVRGRQDDVVLNSRSATRNLRKRHL